jgi:hypothetical protein
MSAWRKEALGRLPQYRQQIQRAENPYDLWIKIHEWFVDAYDQGKPTTIKQIYEYLWWTCRQPRAKTAKLDLFTAAACCFIEHIPEHSMARADMPNWWSKARVVAYKNVFVYHLGENGYAALLKLFGSLQRSKISDQSLGA